MALYFGVKPQRHTSNKYAWPKSELYEPCLSCHHGSQPTHFSMNTAFPHLLIFTHISPCCLCIKASASITIMPMISTICSINTPLVTTSNSTSPAITPTTPNNALGTPAFRPGMPCQPKYGLPPSSLPLKPMSKNIY